MAKYFQTCPLFCGTLSDPTPHHIFDVQLSGVGSDKVPQKTKPTIPGLLVGLGEVKRPVTFDNRVSLLAY